MTNYIVTTDDVVNVGNGRTLVADFDTLFVGRNATLGSSAPGGRGVVLQGISQTVSIAGTVVGYTAIDQTGSGADINILAGGIVSAAYVAIDMAGGSTVRNDGMISGSRGIYCQGSVFLTNTGVLNGGSDALFVLGAGTVRNTGTISAAGTAVFIDGLAKISNFGDILGGIGTQDADDTITNRGLIAGIVQTGLGDDVVDTDGGRIEGQVYLGGGDDTFTGGAFSDRVRGESGRDDISTGGGDDWIVAASGDGSDNVDGGTGIDTYDGRLLTTKLVVNLTTGIARNSGATDLLTGIERAFGGDGADLLTGNAGANRLRGDDGADVLSGLGGADALLGQNGADQLLGGDGNDHLFGGDGKDVLNGGAGNDRLLGSIDADRLTGGAGDDHFVFEDFEDFIPVTESALDRITDFVRGDDVIDLSGIDANGVLAGEQAFRFGGTSAVNALGELSYRFVGATTVISIGYNTPTPFDVLVLDGRLALTAADFVL
jgi:RTX calcium-binding nonapeptide repeat (4 copies)